MTDHNGLRDPKCLQQTFCISCSCLDKQCVSLYSAGQYRKAVTGLCLFMVMFICALQSFLDAYCSGVQQLTLQ